jgi:hypothetical protein
VCVCFLKGGLCVVEAASADLRACKVPRPVKCCVRAGGQKGERRSAEEEESLVETVVKSSTAGHED